MTSTPVTSTPVTSSLVGELDAQANTAPPRDNGELVFEQPWESRAFGLAITMAEAGLFSWDQFREHLSARIAQWESESGDEQAHDWSYYECWLDALEQIVVERGVLETGAVSERAGALSERAPGHDHDHGEHGHGHH